MTAVCSAACPVLPPTPGAARATSASPRPSRSIHDRVVEALALEPGTRVLDVACGTGGVALRAARAGADVVGIDISADQLAKARAAAEADGLEIRFDEGDCEELPYGDAEFDGVASAFGAIFAPDHERAAGELARVCRPGGPARSHGVAEGRVVGRQRSGGADARTGSGRARLGRGSACPRAARRLIRPGAPTRGMAHRSGFGRRALGARLDVDAAAALLARRAERRGARARRAGLSRVPRRPACCVASTFSSWGRADEHADDAARRGHRPPPAPHPRRHDEPARQRDGRGRAPA